MIPVKLGNKRKQTHFTGAGGQPVELYVKPGQKVIHCNVFYLGVVEVNLIEYWRKGTKHTNVDHDQPGTKMSL